MHPWAYLNWFPLLPIIELWEAEEQERHEDVEQVEDGEEDHEVVEGLLGHLPGEEQDTEDVPHQAARAHRHLQEEGNVQSCSQVQDKL